MSQTSNIFPYRVTIRRCSDSQEKDIGVTALGEWDIPSLIAFVGDSDASLCKVAAEGDATFPVFLETTASKQCQIVRKGKLVLHNSAANLASNLSDVSRLITLKERPELSSEIKDVLDRSCIVLLVASWESYVEDILQEGFHWIVRHSSKPDMLPLPLRKLLAKEVREHKDELKPLALAGDGWIKLALSLKEDLLQKTLAKHHNPSAEKIEPLFESLLGLKNLTSLWVWDGVASDIAVAKLTELIKVRGAIAHRVRNSTQLVTLDTADYISFICELVTVTHQAIFNHLYSVTRHSTSQSYWTETSIITHAVKRAVRKQ